MSGPLAAAGAVQEPSEYATLSMDRAVTGLWTQRSPLRDADVPYLQMKFYSASRFDSLLDGINREVTARLTNARRPGHSPYNAETFPALNSFYPFKYIGNGREVLRVLADGKDGSVYDATAGQKTNLFTGSAGASKTHFLGVNTKLFFTNGVDRKKWVRSALVWEAAKTFATNAFIVDSNLNLQLAIGSQTATITGIQIQGNVATLFFSGNTPLTVPVGTKLTLSGLTAVAALNGTVQTVTDVANSQQASFAYTHADVAFTTETGSATTGNGATGSDEPTWATGMGAVTADDGAQWECRGASIQDWMFAAPAKAPSVTQAEAPTIYPLWDANTWYAPAFVITDSNGNLQQLTTAGTTGAGAPTWAVAKGDTTTDGTCVWTNLGAPGWQAEHAYNAGDAIVVSYNYYITVWMENAIVTCLAPIALLAALSPQAQWLAFLLTLALLLVGIVTPSPIEGVEGSGAWVSVPVSATDVFVCTTAGTSGATAPAWAHGINTVTNDGTVVWANGGAQVNWPGANEALSLAKQITDSHGNLQRPTQIGKTGGVAPTWPSEQGAFTTDGTQLWIQGAAYASANTGAWTYAYSGQNSITKDISTASPRSLPITPNLGYQPVLQGEGMADPQIDSLVIWRTAQGQNTLIYLDTIPNPGAGKTWVYTDTTPDKFLIAQIPAPITNTNDPPPVGLRGPIYHLRRIWAFVGANVYYSNGPDTVTGSGDSSWPPLNYIPFPEQVIKLVPITIANGGVLVFTTTNVYVILGTGTFSNPFYATIYLAGVGLLGENALDMVGATIYLFSGKKKFVSLDPSAGYVEVGFPIGDQLLNVTTGAGSATTGALYDPAETFVTWHEQASGDTAIYVADGAVGWFRFSPVASPETGYVWSPRAALVGGTSAVQSVEVTPGQSLLLIGPPAGGGPILYRDSTVHADWTLKDGTYQYVPFPSWDVKGNIVLCQSGEVAEIAHIALKSKAVGTRPRVSLLLGEIAPTATVPFEELAITSTDPPDLPASTTLYSDRYSTLQNGLCPKCDHFQMKVDYGSQNAADELLMFSVYGAKHAERKQQ